MSIISDLEKVCWTKHKWKCFIRDDAGNITGARCSGRNLEISEFPEDIRLLKEARERLEEQMNRKRSR